MTVSQIGQAESAVPQWPECEDDRLLVFLLDASSPLEKEMLEDWVTRSHPTDRTPGAVRVLSLPPSRRPQPRRKQPLDPSLEALLSAEEDALFAPIRIAWLAPLIDGERVVRGRDLLLFGDPRDPGRLRQRLIRARHPDRFRIVVAQPATSSELRNRWNQAGQHGGGTVAGLPEFVARQAILALERAERQIRGARYKVPKLVSAEILDRPDFRGRLNQLAREAGLPDSKVLKEATANLQEIAATHSTYVIDLAARLIRKVYSQGYAEEIEYSQDELRDIAGLSQRHPVVFLPTHKSNLDHLALQYMLYENGLPPNHTAGGINMNFFPLGPIIRRSGVFFIRRSFRDQPLYKLVLRHYIDYLIEKRFALEWYIEGGRSRSGKLLPPKFGLLAYVVDAWRRGKSEDVMLIPVSIAYDQIQEVGGYSDEQQGAAKQKENLGWLVGVIRALRKRYGQIHVRFGEPVSIADQLGAPHEVNHEDPDEQDIALQKLAFEVSVRINRVTPITPTSLLTLALLGTGETALTVPQAQRGLANLMQSVRERKLPTTAQFAQLETQEGIARTFDALVENGVVSRFDGGPEQVYRIGSDQQLEAAYYRNTVIHFFVNAAIAELAAIKASESSAEDALSVFWEEAMALRDLLKFEFFFAEKEEFRNEIRTELTRQSVKWEEALKKGGSTSRKLVQSFKPFTSHRILRPFLESYRVFADALLRIEWSEPVDRDALISSCLGLGKQYQLQHFVQSTSSISKVLFDNAYKLAKNRSLLDHKDPDIEEARRQFASEIADANRRVQVIVALAASRRTGVID